MRGENTASGALDQQEKEQNKHFKFNPSFASF